MLVENSQSFKWPKGSRGFQDSSVHRHCGVGGWGGGGGQPAVPYFNIFYKATFTRKFSTLYFIPFYQPPQLRCEAVISIPKQDAAVFPPYFLPPSFCKVYLSPSVMQKGVRLLEEMEIDFPSRVFYLSPWMCRNVCASVRLFAPTSLSIREAQPPIPPQTGARGRTWGCTSGCFRRRGAQSAASA